ncbi:2-deoxy-D-gluconate 3-dehydrogenase [plant metagenome]|uniref:2-deoxy-D-gluconate 3-dehydrogenase n=1 Tax=plant metagenome TaxID=1297885 RepID=A0A484PT09_9ZZZZ
MSLDTLFGLQGKLAVVTGAARGLGLGIARGLARAGADLVLLDRTASKEAESELSSLGVRVRSLQADLADAAGLAETARRVLEASEGHADILVNNAGLQRRVNWDQHTQADWDIQLDVNLRAAFVLSQQLGAAMAQRGAGKIINIASIRSIAASPAALGYGVSKAGLAQLTRSLAVALAPAGVQVNAIAPGYMQTALTAALSGDATASASALSRVPAGRWGRPDDLQGLTVFLSSAASDYVTGALIPCDGGFLAC